MLSEYHYPRFQVFLKSLQRYSIKIKNSVYAATLIEIALVKILQLEQEISTNQPNIKNNENEASSELNQTLLQSLLDTIATFNQRLDEYENTKNSHLQIKDAETSKFIVIQKLRKLQKILYYQKSLGKLANY